MLSCIFCPDGWVTHRKASPPLQAILLGIMNKDFKVCSKYFLIFLQYSFSFLGMPAPRKFRQLPGDHKFYQGFLFEPSLQLAEILPILSAALPELWRLVGQMNPGAQKWVSVMLLLIIKQVSWIVGGGEGQKLPLVSLETPRNVLPAHYYITLYRGFTCTEGFTVHTWYVRIPLLQMLAVIHGK